MPEAKFVLKEPDSKEATLVYLFYNFNYQRLKYSTGEKILPSNWNPKTQAAKQTRQFPEAIEFNTRLKQLESKVNDLYRRLVNDGIEPTPAKLRELLNEELTGKRTQKKITLFEFIDKFIEDAKHLRKIGTVRSYGTFKKHITDFAKLKNRRIDFESITLEFYSEVIAYLTNEVKLSPNTIGGFIKNLKVIMNEATERGINQNMEFRKRKFSKPSEVTEMIYLNVEDIQKIIGVDLSADKKLERVRDLFIIACYTGIRFSDYFQITPENIVEGNKLKIKSIKTNQLSVIPLNSIILEILSKYSFQLPKPVNNQKMNEYLKDIGKLAKLEEPVTISRIKGRDKESITTPKYQLICTHTARRSFATNAYKANVPIVNIMQLTGHTQVKTFQQYIRITQEENANNLSTHPFFA